MKKYLRICLKKEAAFSLLFLVLHGNVTSHGKNILNWHNM